MESRSTNKLPLKRRSRDRWLRVGFCLSHTRLEPRTIKAREGPGASTKIHSPPPEVGRLNPPSECGRLIGMLAAHTRRPEPESRSGLDVGQMVARRWSNLAAFVFAVPRRLISACSANHNQRSRETSVAKSRINLTGFGPLARE